MAFYLRRGFNFGPVRLNLSKGGVGVSGGITGARAGMSPRGAYVHGGRGGLYYRKYARKGRGRSPARFGPQHAAPPASEHGYAGSTGGMVEVFVDTGATFPSPVRIRKPYPFPAPDLPRTERLLYFGALPGMLLLPGGAAGLFGGVVMAIGLLLLAVSTAGHLFFNGKNRWIVDVLLALRKELDRDAPRTHNIREILDQLSDRVVCPAFKPHPAPVLYPISGPCGTPHR